MQTKINQPAYASRLNQFFSKQLASSRFSWRLIVIILLFSVAYFSPQTKLAKLNYLIQDFIVAHQTRPLTNDIVIVAIDDASIAKLGRWPWRRSLHVELINKIALEHPAAIGLDILFTEPDVKNPADDVALSEAIRNNHVVLPILTQGIGAFKTAVLPITAATNSIHPTLANLAHINLKIDNDGVIRSVNLLETTADNAGSSVSGQPKVWPHFSLALLKNAGMTTAKTAKLTQQNSPHNILIPYAGSAGYFKRVSYSDVITGQVPAGTFSNKIVMVASIASGVGDLYTTPTENDALLMPGVEIMANILDGFIQNKTLAHASNMQNIALNLAVVLITLLAFKLLNPLSALLSTICLALILLGVSYLAADYIGLLFAPSAGLLGLMAVYPLWSWHRLSTAMDYLTVEYESFTQSNFSLQTTTTEKPLMQDFLEKRIAALTGVTKQLQGMHRFIVESVDGLSDPTLVCDLLGNIKISNKAAAKHFRVQNADELLSDNILILLNKVISNQTNQPFLNRQNISQQAILIEGEGRDAEKRDVLLKCAPVRGNQLQHTGWIVSLIDISDILKAERERDEAFRFIAHDIRSPISGIIALLELQRLQQKSGQAASENPQMLSKIERLAENAIALADDYMSLSSVNNMQAPLTESDLTDILAQAVDNVWLQAQKRDVKIATVCLPETGAMCNIERSQIERALTNIISNAVKFSLYGSEVSCTLSQLKSQDNGQQWQITIKDFGLGMDAEAQKKLFQPFSRLHKQSNPEIAGTGLGLAFVQAVVQKHGGQILVKSALNQGSTFTVLLPIQ